jgi:GTPase SAR1 family protein
MVQQWAVFTKAWAKTVNVFVTGEAGAGKTGLAIRLCQDAFYDDYDPTIDDERRKLMDVLGAAVIVNVTDAAGGEIAFLRHLWRDAEVIVLCIDTSHRVKECLAAAREVMVSHGLRADRDLKPSPSYGDEMLGRPILLCATKCDLPRQIAGIQLIAFAKTHRTGLVVTSSKHDVRVVQAFEECVKYAAARRVNSWTTKPEKTGCVIG